MSNQQRVIKFRGKRKDNGEWVYGNLVDREKPFIVGRMIESNEEYCNLDWWHPVLPETVGEFSGLHDKNGKEIWEGDLIRDGGGWTWEVSFSNGKFYLLSREKDLRPDMDINTGLSYCQVLGNVHENKEPLNA